MFLNDQGQSVKISILQSGDDARVSQRRLSCVVQSGAEHFKIIQQEVHHRVVCGEKNAISGERCKAQVKTNMILMGGDSSLDLLIRFFDQTLQMRVILLLSALYS